MQDATKTILCVDDDPVVLSMLQASLQAHWAVHCEPSAMDAIRWLATRPPAQHPRIVLSDQHMPGMTGIAFLAWVKEHCPSSQRVLLTGHPDVALALAAINQGEIFRFLTKPWSAQELHDCVTAAWIRTELVRAEQDVMERTVNGVLEVMVDTVAMLAPEAFRWSLRLRALVRGMAAELGYPDGWRLEAAAALAPLGLLALPAGLAERQRRHEALRPEEQAQWEEHPRIAYRMISRIPRLHDVAALVLHQDPTCTPQEPPLDLREEVAILRAATSVCHHLDARGDTAGAISALPADTPERVKQAMVTVLQHKDTSMPAILGARHLMPNMRLQQGVTSMRGEVLVPAGTLLTAPVIERLRIHARTGDVHEPIRVLIP